MAEAVQQLFPGVRFGIGPAIEDGFYYDFDLPRPLTPEDLEEIEQRMREIVAEEHNFVYQEIDEQEAHRLFANQPYKLELVEGILSAGTDEYGEPLDAPPVLSIYRSGPFVEVRGPMPWAACGQYAGDQPQSVQAAEHCRRILARRRASADAPTYLRHGMAHGG